jgi:hypothetical protein
MLCGSRKLKGQAGAHRAQCDEKLLPCPISLYIRYCFHVFISFHFLAFCEFSPLPELILALHPCIVRNPIGGYAESLELLETGLWFTSGT